MSLLFRILEASKRSPCRAEPPYIGHYREYPSPGESTNHDLKFVVIFAGVATVTLKNLLGEFSDPYNGLYTEGEVPPDAVDRIMANRTFRPFFFSAVLMEVVVKHYTILFWFARGGSRGRVQGVRTPPDDLRPLSN